MKVLSGLILLLNCLSLAAMEETLTISEHEYNLFKVIQKVRTIAAESRKEIEDKCGSIDSRGLSKAAPEPSAKEVCLSTAKKEAFCLIMQEFPLYLETPWGRVYIRKDDSHYVGIGGLGSEAASQLFLKRVKVHLLEYGYLALARGYYEVTENPIPLTQASSKNNNIFSDKTRFKELAYWQLDDYIGKPNFIVSPKCGQITRYQIDEVDSVPAPSVEQIPVRSPEAIAKIWQIMQERYEKEH